MSWQHLYLSFPICKTDNNQTELCCSHRVLVSAMQIQHTCQNLEALRQHFLHRSNTLFFRMKRKRPWAQKKKWCCANHVKQAGFYAEELLDNLNKLNSTHTTWNPHAQSDSPHERHTWSLNGFAHKEGRSHCLCPWPEGLAMLRGRQVLPPAPT